MIPIVTPSEDESLSMHPQINLLTFLYSGLESAVAWSARKFLKGTYETCCGDLGKITEKMEGLPRPTFGNGA